MIVLWGFEILNIVLFAESKNWENEINNEYKVLMNIEGFRLEELTNSRDHIDHHTGGGTHFRKSIQQMTEKRELKLYAPMCSVHND